MTGDPRARRSRRYTRWAPGASTPGRPWPHGQGPTRTGVSPNAGYVERPALDEYLRLGYVPHERNSNFSTYIVNQYTRAA